jgi:hypothetical protein
MHAHTTDRIHDLEHRVAQLATTEKVASITDPSARFVAERVLAGTPVPQNAATIAALEHALDALG